MPLRTDEIIDHLTSVPVVPAAYACDLWQHDEMPPTTCQVLPISPRMTPVTGA